jgi:hypothetical protein
MPIPFYICCIVILGLGFLAFEARWEGWGIPMGMVLGTVSVWYVGDAFYNDYGAYEFTFGKKILREAWWQVLIFLVAFGWLVPCMHFAMNRPIMNGRSYVMAYLEYRRHERPEVQRRIAYAATGLFIAWTVLMSIALLKVRGDFLGLFAPYLGQKADPWARGQIGGGYSALISLGSYFQIYLTAACGVVAALARNGRVRTIALCICLLAMPPYIFDRTRNTMLAVVMPGLLAWILMRLRMTWAGKAGVLLAAFLVVNFWFAVVMTNRQGMSFDISGAIDSVSGEKEVEYEHRGLNMFEELAWIRMLEKQGLYRPNMGQRYFAEIVNPIPRALWKNKPMIGLDYALARGQSVVGAHGETSATISTGMIGQGVVNFGPVFGPIASAFLMSMWVALLARQDLLGTNPGRIVLYGIGLILTFNLGRDITLLVLYPYVFGWMLFMGWMWWEARVRSAQAPSHRRQRGIRKRVSDSDSNPSGWTQTKSNDDE